MPDKLEFFTVFNFLSYGSIDTLEHSISPLLNSIPELEHWKNKIFENLKDEPNPTALDSLCKLNFTAFEKARLGYHSIGFSLIICFSELIKKIANERAAADERFGLRNKSKHQYFQIGPKVGSAYWAEGIICASNYVRHDDEWKNWIKPNSMKKNGIHYNVTYEDINWDEQVNKFPNKNRARENAQLLNGLGVPYETFLKHDAFAGFEIAHELHLYDKEKSLVYFKTWLDTLMLDLQRALGFKMPTEKENHK